MSKKSIEQWEKEKGFLFTASVDLKKQMDEEEFTEFLEKHLTDQTAVGVDYKSRIEYLQSKGHKVTRQNLIDSSL